MAIEILPPWTLSRSDLDRWTALQDSQPMYAPPFLSPQWARAVDRAQNRNRDNVRVAVLHENGALKGFFPVRVSAFTAMPAGSPMCDYQGLVAEPGVQVSSNQLLQALGVDRLDFTHMLQDQSTFSAHMRGSAPSYVIRLSNGYEAYQVEKRAAGSGVLKDLDKRRRKVEREVGPVTFTAWSRSAADFEKLVAWKRAQYRATGQTDIFATGWPRRLLQDMFESRDPDFGGVFFTLHIGDQLAAAHLHLRGKRTVHAWIIAHDPAFERYSPGLLLFQDVMRWMDDTPYDTLDLGAGDYRFKQQLANDHRMVAHGFIGRPSASSLVRQAAYSIRDTAERLPLGRFSALPGKAMRRYDIIRALR
ncbi:MAG: GNAT family N-acetyltransferase [Clostridia bacterium]|nr:GNAT family N-acetyltransferase [Caulobacteraceae bacterium]MBQ8109228.1 GNAT family N-acetyltransferase [Clostridia bacterium]